MTLHIPVEVEDYTMSRFLLANGYEEREDDGHKYWVRKKMAWARMNTITAFKEVATIQLKAMVYGGGRC